MLNKKLKRSTYKRKKSKLSKKTKIRIGQKGGDFKEIQEYIVNLHKSDKIDMNTRRKLLMQAHIKYMQPAVKMLNPDITILHFIDYINGLDDKTKILNRLINPDGSPIILVNPVSLEEPARLDMSNPFSDHNPDMIKCIITGLNDASIKSENRKVQLLIDNIYQTITTAGKDCRFYYYDIFGSYVPHFHRNEVVKNEFFNIASFNQLKGRNDMLLVDLAHLIHYYKNGNNVTKLYFDIYNDDFPVPSIRPQNERYDDINSFYPGYIPDMINMDFIRNFKFFQIERDGSIKTFIDKGNEKEIVLRYTDNLSSRQDACKFNVTNKHQFLISGKMSETGITTERLNTQFWMN